MGVDGWELMDGSRRMGVDGWEYEMDGSRWMVGSGLISALVAG